VTKAEKAVLAILGAALLALVFVVGHAAQDVLRQRPVPQNVLQSAVDSMRQEIEAARSRVNKTMVRCEELHEKALVLARRNARPRR